MRALVREPLVHFAILGALLFTLDAATRERDATAPEACGGLAVPRGPIVVDATLRSTLAEQWTKNHPSPPTDAELAMLVERWIDEEVLYREGLARGLAEGDALVRERIAGQMAYVLGERIVVPEPSDDDLRAAFAADPARWSIPDRIDLTQVFVAGTDEAAEARARELLALLHNGADPNGLGDTFSGGRRFRGRRIDELAERFGDAFVVGLATQPERSWVLRRSSTGLHLVRVDRRVASAAPELDTVRDEVRHDWQATAREQALRTEKEALRAHWEVVTTP
ncbi:MAG TPA: peptidylprolyl isomerase [Nannocystaceae bacterium]|nr:peptidylprolyl isomerase [Nannocystaceae bacterium]